jgi:hypothetical protein
MNWHPQELEMIQYTLLKLSGNFILAVGYNFVFMLFYLQCWREQTSGAQLRSSTIHETSCECSAAVRGSIDFACL